MKKTITAYRLGGEPFEIRAAPHTRPWMDATNKGYAYRCMPLVAANSYGWELLCPEAVYVTWNGGVGLDAITIQPAFGWCVSHFGYGIVTFQIPYLIQTPKDIDLFVSGPANRYRDGALALEGIVETSWSSMTWTMNWRLTQPNKTVTFERDEPICRMVPISREILTGIEATIIENDQVPKEIMEPHREWNESRGEFLNRLKTDPETTKQGWQKTYFKRAKLVKLPEFKKMVPA